MTLLLLLGVGVSDGGAPPAAPEPKRLPSIPTMATVPTMNRKKRRR